MQTGLRAIPMNDVRTVRPEDWWANHLLTLVLTAVFTSFGGALLTTAFWSAGVAGWQPTEKDRETKATRKRLFSMTMWMALIVTPAADWRGRRAWYQHAGTPADQRIWRWGKAT